jgi:hypothetical protein
MPFIDKSGPVIDKVDKGIDIALAHLAQDIERSLKTDGKMPVDKGQMKANTRHRRIDAKQYIVEIRKNYALYQEVGKGKNGTTFRNYTTAGTGKHFFKYAIEKARDKTSLYFKNGLRLAGLK